MDKHLYLFGGAPPFTPKLAKQFVLNCLNKKLPVSILIVERDGWESYMPKYTNALKELGLEMFHFLPLPSTSTEKVTASLNTSAGIIIGGGDTNLYADFIVDTPISHTLKEKYDAGVPVAGFSAGALISPDYCIISPKDNVREIYQQRRGLGLITDWVLAVHFTQWNDEDHLRNAANKFKGYRNLGIDENNGVYFHNGRLEEVEGDGIYSLDAGLLKRLC